MKSYLYIIEAYITKEPYMLIHDIEYAAKT